MGKSDESIVFRLGADASGLTRGLKEGQAALGVFGDAAGNAMGSLKTLVAGVAAGIGLAKLTHEALEYADAIQRVADQTGMTAESVQFFRFAAEQAGTSVEGVTSLVSKMQRQMVEAGDGNEKVAKAFADLNLNLADLRNLAPEDQLQAVAMAVAAIPDQAQQAALAVDVFGKAGADAIPLIKQLADHGGELRDNFEAMGGPVSADAIAAVDAIGDTASQAALGFKSMAVELLSVVAPAIIAGLESIRDIVGGIRVLAGEGGNKIVDLDNEIANLTSTMDHMRENNPFGGEFIDRQLIKMEAQRQALIHQQEAMLGLGDAGKSISFGMEEASLSLDSMLVDFKAMNIEYESEEMAHQERLKRIRDDARSVELDAITEANDFKVEKIKVSESDLGEAQKIEMSKAEEFRNKTMDAQVGIVSGALTDMTAGVARESKAMFEINKAAAIASAVVNTAQGITQALGAYPPPISFVMAAAQAAAGAVQIKAIASQKWNSGSGAAPSQAGQVAQPVTNVGGNGSGNGGGGGGGGVLRVEGLSSDSIMSGASARVMAQKLLEYQKDGGQVVFDK